MNYVSMHQNPDNNVMEEPLLALHLLIPRIDIQNLTIVWFRYALIFLDLKI